MRVAGKDRLKYVYIDLSKVASQRDQFAVQVVTNLTNMRLDSSRVRGVINSGQITLKTKKKSRKRIQIPNSQKSGHPQFK